jgi:hypothetical protein
MSGFCNEINDPDKEQDDRNADDDVLDQVALVGRSGHLGPFHQPSHISAFGQHTGNRASTHLFKKSIQSVFNTGHVLIFNKVRIVLNSTIIQTNSINS